MPVWTGVGALMLLPVDLVDVVVVNLVAPGTDTVVVAGDFVQPVELVGNSVVYFSFLVLISTVDEN